MRRLFRWLFWYPLLLALCAVVVVQFWFLMHIWYWAGHNPDSTAFMRARLAILRVDDPNDRLAHRWIRYERISKHLKQAVIAAEDAKFMTHTGFDWGAMKDAHKRNLQDGEIVRCASTITQQLAKNL